MKKVKRELFIAPFFISSIKILHKMKLFKVLLILVIITLSTSCNAQEQNNTLMLNYTAQTRGFNYVLQLNNNDLKITKNGKITTLKLSKKQVLAINTLISKIDFTKIENEFSKEKAAVDRVIPAVFIFQYNKKQYNYNFEHNNTPKQIQELLNVLDGFVTLEE